jgi:TatA/E family protein of Tat protein translocase
MGGRFGEIVLVLILLLLFFGPNKLPDMAKAMGQALNEFKKAANPNPEPQPPNQAVLAKAAPARRSRKPPSRKSRAKTSR